MNFYRAQDAARRKTWQLTLLFLAAVLTLILLTNLLVALVFLWSSDVTQIGSTNLEALAAKTPAKTWFVITAGVVGIVASAVAYKYLIVRGGGRSIAESLGGTRIFQATEDTKQKRLLNVVEEMSLAAGIAVPPVYLIPEPSINAFAAGFSHDDAVIGINQGTLDHLSRDELQGVIAHEFSHILNGDTRINLRLIALLHGILFIGMIGYTLMRGAGYSRRHSSRESNGGLPIVLLGIGLLIIGYGGTFFGNLIKAAVSRQREYLADAAAVQFTRNPTGIANALKKIGGLPAGSGMLSARAAEASHMFFGQAVTTFLNSIMSTHPPLDERIRAIEPGWDGSFPALTPVPADTDVLVSGFDGSADYDLTSVELKEDALAKEVGEMSQRGHANAQTVVDSTPVHIQQAAKDPWSARCVVYAMLLADAQEVRTAQLEHLNRKEARGVTGLLAELDADIRALDHLHKLTLLELSMPALKEMSTRQYREFIDHTVALTKLDARIDLFEWVLHQILIKDLRPHYEKPDTRPRRYGNLEKCRNELVLLLSVLAHNGHSNPMRRMLAFAEGMGELGMDADLLPAPEDNYASLTRALGKLRQIRPLVKPKVIKACAATALADDHITVAEGALLQGISATLDCPLPPSIYAET